MNVQTAKLLKKYHSIVAMRDAELPDVKRRAAMVPTSYLRFSDDYYDRLNDFFGAILSIASDPNTFSTDRIIELREENQRMFSETAVQTNNLTIILEKYDDDIMPMIFIRHAIMHDELSMVSRQRTLSNLSVIAARYKILIDYNDVVE